MATQTVTPGSWVSITTTTADTAFQNQSYRELYIITGSTGGVGLREGFLLAPWQSIVIQSGLAVSASAWGGDGEVFYMEV